MNLTQPDPAARAKFAELLRALFLGRITNDQFDDQASDLAKRDSVIREIYSLGAWPSYDDTRKYKLAGRDAPTQQQKKNVARWILFLKSGTAYEWPPEPSLPKSILIALFFCGVPLALYTWRWEFSILGFFVPILLQDIYVRMTWHIEKAGDVNYWPFFSEAALNQAKLSPPYLGGR